MQRTSEAHLDTGHVPVTQGLAMGLAPAPSLLHALVRECRDMGPTLSMEVTCIGSLGPSRCIGVGWLRPEYYVMYMLREMYRLLPLFQLFNIPCSAS